MTDDELALRLDAATDHLRAEVDRQMALAPLARCQPHGTEYPWMQDCPACEAAAKGLGVSIDHYYRWIRPRLPLEQRQAGTAKLTSNL